MIDKPHRTSVSVSEAVQPFEKLEGLRWTKYSGNEWMLTVTGQTDRHFKDRKSKFQIVFNRLPDLQGDVLITRFVVDGNDEDLSHATILFQDAYESRGKNRNDFYAPWKERGYE